MAAAKFYDAAVMLSGGYDGGFRLFDLTSGEMATLSTGHRDGGMAGTVSAVALGVCDGRPVAATGGHDDGEVRVWDLVEGTQLGEPLTGHVGPISAVAVGDLGNRSVVISGGEDSTVRIFDLVSHRKRELPVGSPVLSLAITAPGLVIGTVAGLLFIEARASF
jgi:WD40 repeat protein